MHARTTKDSVAQTHASSRRYLGLALAVVALALAACRTKEKFPTIGLNIASPVDLANAEDGKYFYVLNSDFDNTYGVGSLLVLDRNGQKLSAVEVPRMGRSIAISGKTLLVTVDYQREATNDRYPPHAMLFDLSDPEHPQLKRDWQLDCSPLNGVMGGAYLAVSCSEGSIFAGSLPADISQATLQRVRGYSAAYRAIYIDPNKNLLIGFPTEVGKVRHADAELVDSRTYTTTTNPSSTDGGNEVPDQFENTPREQANQVQRGPYRYFVYDLAQESANAPNCPDNVPAPCAFPIRDTLDSLVQAELRWTFYHLNNFDGSPDQSDHFNDPAFKFYRTNFYAAQPDPEASNVFYVSHRGSPDQSRWANQIVRVTITGDLHSKVNADGKTYTPPTTANTLSFERVYGFKGAEATKFVYPSDFRVRRINGQKTVLVNNIRDLVNWVRSDTYFSLGAQVLDQPDWFSEQVGGLSPKDDIRSYNQVVVNADGRGMTCSYYGNSVVLFDVVPGVGLNIVGPIK